MNRAWLTAQSSLSSLILLSYHRRIQAVPYYLSLNKSQWLPQKELEAIQTKKLRRLVTHAYTTIPYYHKRMRALGVYPADIVTIRDLPKLPIISKQELKANLSEATSRAFSREEIHMDNTSGSTGTPLTFFKDKKAMLRRSIAAWRFAEWYGLHPGVRHALITSSPFNRPQPTNIVKTPRKRRVTLSSFAVTENDLSTYIEILRDFKPKIITGYASALYLVARRIRASGVTDIRPISVVSSAETLFDFFRQEIENAFGCKVFNHYGSREITSIAQECEQHNGLHVNAENRIVECVRQGDNANPSELGELIVTDLDNYAMPFIRYNTEDVSSLIPDRCLCGRGLPLISDIKGRALDMIITPDGRMTTGEFFTRLMREYPTIRQYQVIQNRIDELVLKIVKADDRAEKDVDAAVKVIQKYLGPSMQIIPELVSSISPSKSGKHRFVISEIAASALRQEKLGGNISDMKSLE